MELWRPINHLCSEGIADYKPFRINFDSYNNAFDFLGTIYWDKRQAAKDVIRQSDGRLLSDVAASALTRVFCDGFLSKEKYKMILECVRDIIIDCGNNECTEARLRDLLSLPPAKYQNVMLIAGCQNPTMLNRRVERAAELACEYKHNMRVVASGANPDSSREVQIPYEAGRIDRDFKAIVDSIIPDRAKQPKIDVLPEMQSKNTKGNIDAFFKGGYLKEGVINQVILVSSSSHLIRLSQNFMNYLTENKEHIHYKISNLILVGSEPTSMRFYVDHAQVFRHVVLEIYDYFLRRKYPELFTNGANGKPEAGSNGPDEINSEGAQVT